jgi:hypothetical protein
MANELLAELSLERDATERVLAVSESLRELWKLETATGRLRDVPMFELRSTVQRIAVLSASLSE